MTLITSHLALGNSEDPFHFGEHVDEFLCCAAEISLPRKKPGYHLALKDGFRIDDELLDAAYHFLDEQLQENRLVLVYRGQGTSRSASVLAGYLALKSGEKLDLMVNQIRRSIPAVLPSRGTLNAITRYINQRRTPRL